MSIQMKRSVEFMLLEKEFDEKLEWDLKTVVFDISAIENQSSGPVDCYVHQPNQIPKLLFSIDRGCILDCCLYVPYLCPHPHVLKSRDGSNIGIIRLRGRLAFSLPPLDDRFRDMIIGSQVYRLRRDQFFAKSLTSEELIKYFVRHRGITTNKDNFPEPVLD